jgi:ribosomal protein S18 acetylase RimI-like enzyme
MATLDSTMLDYEKPDAMRYLRVHGPMYRAALGMLLTGKPDGTDPAVTQFVNFARQQSMNIDECWAACHLDLIQATLLLVPSAGKTSMAFLSSVPTRKHIQTMGKLAANACEVQDGKHIRIIQALLESNQRFELLALEQAGFKHLAHLIYMQRYVTASDRTATRFCPGSNVQVYNWSEENRKRFADAILASYVDTLDCPMLLGVRQIDDVIAGHMAAGEFDPSRWFALYDGDTPLGVMLLNRISHRSALELVYLGLAPIARGKGFARQLLQHAMNITADHNACQILLAVDQENQPARKLYQRMGFARGEKKTALIYLLDPKEDAMPSCDVSA